jgi:hypothetical protein
MSEDTPFDRTRRAVLQSIAAALGTGAAGAAAGHPGADEKDGIDQGGGEPFELDGGEPFRAASAVGYHSLGDVGPAGLAGQPGQRHDGDRNAEVRTHGDIAVTCFRASDDEDAGRRMAVLDISEFNDAATKAELEDAELRVLSILRNFSAAANGATDVKLSGDGDYAFLGTQALVPYDGGSNGEINETDPRGNVETTGGVIAVDISDPTRPRTVDRVDGAFSTGVHNVFHHTIDGTDYVFACKDVGFLSPDSGLYVLRFDRDPGKLTVVNRWTADGNTVRGEVGPEHGLSYVHDVEVHDDPRTGRPTAYLADWDRGMRVLDVSDPTDIEHVGQFDMYQSHFAAPFPQLVETPDGGTKRVAVASHEEPDERFDQRDSDIYNTPHVDKTNPNSTGTVFLVDCDGIYPEDPAYEEDRAGPKQLGELDNWTWKNVDTDEDVAYEDIEQTTFSFQLSPHNSQPAVHEIDGETRYFLHQGHYHGGARYLEVRPGGDDGLTEIDGGTPGEEGRRAYRPPPNPNVEDREGEDEFGWINNSTDWELVDVGHARPTNETTGNLTPDFWSSVEHNGVTYSGDRSAGVWVTYYDGEVDRGPDRDAIPLEKPRPPVEVERTDHGQVFFGGQTNRVRITVETFERGNGEAADLLVRDRIPDGHTVGGGDDSETYPQGNRTAVEFGEAVEPGESHTFAYYVSGSEAPGSGTFGPVEISGDGGDSWVTVGGTTDSNVGTGFSL